MVRLVKRVHKSRTHLCGASRSPLPFSASVHSFSRLHSRQFSVNFAPIRDNREEGTLAVLLEDRLLRSSGFDRDLSRAIITRMRQERAYK